MVITTLFLILMVVNAVDVCPETSKLRKKDMSDADIEMRKFIPTNEWQVIRDGQAVPAGLHYRINLETGLKEAKLPDENIKVSDPNSAVILVSPKKKPDDEKPQEKDKYSVFDSCPDIVEYKHSTFESYESLKKILKDLNLQIKADVELLGELLTRFASKNVDQHKEEEEIISILTDLEYLVHQYDSAQEFADIGGIADVIFLCLNASSVSIRSEAILLLSSALQNNPKVQIKALESGSISFLLRLLMLDNSPVIRARAVHALSCLIRRFPLAQLKMINAGGLSVLGQLYQTKGQNDLKLQIKIITLLYDLIMEYKEADYALNVPYEGANRLELVEKQRQYKVINLPQHLVEGGWCKKLPRLLRDPTRNREGMKRSVVSDKLNNGPDHDLVEKVIQAMLALFDYCTSDFVADPDLQEKISNLQKCYDELSLKEELGKKYKNSEEISEYCSYYINLAKQLQELSEKLKMIKKEE